MRGWPIRSDKWGPPPVAAPAPIPETPKGIRYPVSAGAYIPLINFTAPEDGYLVFVPKAAKPQ